MNMKLILAVVIVGFLFAGCDKKEATQSENGPSGAAKATSTYDNAGISFQYPISWHSAQSIAAMRTQLTNELRNFNRTLVAFDMFISSDEEVALLVTKVQTDNALTEDDILSERGKVYDDATRTGDVTKINKLETTTIKNLPAVVEDVERSNGGRGHTVKLLNGKYIVELSLIVNNKAKYEKHIGTFDEILASLKLQEEEAEIKATTSTVAVGVAAETGTRGSVASLVQKNGTVLKGEILGTVLLAKGPMLAVFNGKDIVSIDQTGVRLKPDSVIMQAGWPFNTESSFLNVKPVDILRVALPAAAKIDTRNAFVGTVPDPPATALLLGGDTDDARVLWVSVGGQRTFVFKRRVLDTVDTDAPRLPVAGEMRDNRGTISITPLLRVQTGSSIVSVSVDSLAPLQSVAK